jgi:redox-sensitive bicupin YhaK (pirin superfamily)
MDDTATLEIVNNDGHLSERLGKVVKAISHNIGEGFTALHFSEEMFDGRMDPLLMVDHFVMTEPTFAPHLHAGISAVTAMFEDSEGGFVNRDTLGHNLALKGGDLYWLAAANGAVHEERPEDGARTHALQIFVNLPALLKAKPARAFHVPAQDVPILQEDRYRVRVMLGRSGDATGAEGTPEEMTMLDGFLQKDGHFSHRLAHERHAWIYAVSGKLTVCVQDEERVLDAGTATTISAGPGTEIVLLSDEPAHFVLLAGRPINESFVKHGPLVMSTAEDIRRTLAGYAAGKFGCIPA